MIICLPGSVRFPVTITELAKKQGDKVNRLDTLLFYSYKAKVTTYPEFGVEKIEEKELNSKFDAPVDGKLKSWLIKPGTVIHNSRIRIVEIEEPCTHEVQFMGLCGQCGLDMTELDYNSTHFSNTSRATIQLAHDSSGLTVSEDEARKLEEQAKRRLLKEKKLSLVVDLDQTIIHATVDPTVGEWKNDPYCINHESVKEVAAFKLDEDVSGGRGTWYYVKMRPGLKKFLEAISKLYELHIYTMGTRAYALAVKKIVDPDGKLFGERVLSRDESGSMTQKSLQRLFPIDTKMVVIIDDRGDVWKWSENLVKVRPYDFFVGIGDINSMFLPKKQEFPTSVPSGTVPPKALLAVEETKKEEEEGLGKDSADPAKAATAPHLSALDQLITMGSGDDQQLITEQSTELEKAIEAQKEGRPLAKKQELQDKMDEKIASLAAATENGTTTPDNSSDGTSKHSVLRDNDWELYSLHDHLIAVHDEFYKEFEKNKTERQKGRGSQLETPIVKPHPQKRSAPEELDLDAVPDVADIMPKMKRMALSGVVMVFSGVIPLCTNIQNADIALWAKNFGAVVCESVTSKVTHLIAARPRTTKVRQATRYPHIKIVNPNWLYDSISNWKHEEEDRYIITIHPEDRHPGGPDELPSINDGNGPLLSSEDETGSDEEDEYDSELEGETKVDVSNVKWGDASSELAEFLGDDDDDDDEDEDGEGEGNGEDGAEDGEDASQDGEDRDSDTESVRTVEIEVGKRKRTAGPLDEDGDIDVTTEENTEDESVSDTGSRLAKRQKIARDRAAAGSGLRDVEISVHQDDAGIKSQEQEDQENDDLADELDRELMNLGDDDEAGLEDEAAGLQVGDVEVRDIEIKDAEANDIEVRDVEVNDFEAKDTEVNDAEVNDAEVNDAGVKDAEIKDADVKNAEVKDAEVNDVDLSPEALFADDPSTEALFGEDASTEALFTEDPVTEALFTEVASTGAAAEETPAATEVTEGASD